MFLHEMSQADRHKKKGDRHKKKGDRHKKRSRKGTDPRSKGATRGTARASSSQQPLPETLAPDRLSIPLLPDQARVSTASCKQKPKEYQARVSTASCKQKHKGYQARVSTAGLVGSKMNLPTHRGKARRKDKWLDLDTQLPPTPANHGIDMQALERYKSRDQEYPEKTPISPCIAGAMDWGRIRNPFLNLRPGFWQSSFY